jgi:hypothetical protein
VEDGAVYQNFSNGYGAARPTGGQGIPAYNRDLHKEKPTPGEYRDYGGQQRKAPRKAKNHSKKSRKGCCGCGCATAVLALAAMVIARAICPVLIFPGFGIPNLVLISLVALVLDHYLVKEAKRCYICIPVFAFLTFVVLPLAAGFAAPVDTLWLGVKGCITFTATTWLFTSMAARISTGPSAKLAPIMSALGLYLASQCFMGMF